MRRLFYSCYLVLLSLPLPLKGQQIHTVIIAYFKEVRSGKYQSIPKNLTLAENAKSTLSSISPYLTDTSSIVRSKAYAIVQLAGNNSRQNSVRQDAVTKLVDAVKDKDAGNVGLVLGYLQEFRKDDFNSAAKDTLTNIFRRKSSHYDELIKLLGFLEITAVRDALRSLSQQNTNNKAERWAALLALSRIGDAYATADIMKRVGKLPVTDEVIYQIYPDLVYTRDKAAISSLVTVLNSDAANCESADAERSVKIPCAYRVMEMLVPAIEGYPLQLDESGDIKSDDYVASLQKVRAWFKDHPNFKINKDKF